MMNESKAICLENHHLEIQSLQSRLAEKEAECAALKQQLAKAKTLQRENWNDFKRSEQKLSVAVEALKKIGCPECNYHGENDCPVDIVRNALDLINGEKK